MLPWGMYLSALLHSEQALGHHVGVPGPLWESRVVAEFEWVLAQGVWLESDHSSGWAFGAPEAWGQELFAWYYYHGEAGVVVTRFT